MPELTGAQRRKLQGLINRTARTQAAYHTAQDDLNNWCLDHYGTEPGDVDADGIIDALFGGAGSSTAISADEFDAEMRLKTE